MSTDNPWGSQPVPTTVGQREDSSSETISRLYLVDDHQLLRQGLCQLIERQIDLTVIGESADGEHACREIESLLPDLVLLDYSMKGWSGAQTTRHLKETCPQVKVLAFTIHSGPPYREEMLKAGASGYVSKLSSAATLLEAIRTTLTGQSFPDPYLGADLPDRLSPPEEPPPLEIDLLSPRERSVLIKVAQGYTNKEIAAQLDLSISSVETDKARGMRKLSLRDRVDVIRYALAQHWLAV